MLHPDNLEMCHILKSHFLNWSNVKSSEMKICVSKNSTIILKVKKNIKTFQICYVCVERYVQNRERERERGVHVSIPGR